MSRTVGDAHPPRRSRSLCPHTGDPPCSARCARCLRTKPNLSPNGVPPALVSDAVAALAALNTSPGLPDNGIVALLDFGGSGTSITLADAAADFQPIDETLRYAEFSGAQIDQALLTHVLADINQSSGVDPAGTTAVGALARLRDQARQAKERLSAETATDLPARAARLPLRRPGHPRRAGEPDQQPLAGVIGALEEMLQRNRIPAASLAAVATVGGGAAIPLITQRLSEHFRVPVVTTPQPALNTAAGAALLAARGPGADVPTGLAAAAADAATGMATAAWAAGAAGAAATESAADGSASATFRALAWSQDEGGDEPVPYSGADYAYDPDATSARPQMEFSPASGRYPQPPPRPAAARRRAAVVVPPASGAVRRGAGRGAADRPAAWSWTLTSRSSPISIRAPRTTTHRGHQPRVARRSADRDHDGHRHRRQSHRGDAATVDHHPGRHRAAARPRPRRRRLPTDHDHQPQATDDNDDDHHATDHHDDDPAAHHDHHAATDDDTQPRRPRRPNRRQPARRLTTPQTITTPPLDHAHRVPPPPPASRPPARGCYHAAGVCPRRPSQPSQRLVTAMSGPAPREVPPQAREVVERVRGRPDRRPKLVVVGGVGTGKTATLSAVRVGAARRWCRGDDPADVAAAGRGRRGRRRRAPARRRGSGRAGRLGERSDRNRRRRDAAVSAPRRAARAHGRDRAREPAGRARRAAARTNSIAPPRPRSSGRPPPRWSAA